MRCFIEIDLPESIKEYIEEKITQIMPIKNRTSRHIFMPVKKKNLHITLAFLGEIDEKELKTVIKNVSETIKKFDVFECSLSKIEAFPEKFPRMIWISLNESKELSELYNELKKALMLRDEHGGFKAHITAARIRPGKPARISANNRINIRTSEIKIEPLKFSVKEIKIMQSILKNEGVEYNIIKSIPLGTKKA